MLLLHRGCSSSKPNSTPRPSRLILSTSSLQPFACLTPPARIDHQRGALIVIVKRFLKPIRFAILLFPFLLSPCRFIPRDSAMFPFLEFCRTVIALFLMTVSPCCLLMSLRLSLRYSLHARRISPSICSSPIPFRPQLPLLFLFAQSRRDIFFVIFIHRSTTALTGFAARSTVSLKIANQLHALARLVSSV